MVNEEVDGKRRRRRRRRRRRDDPDRAGIAALLPQVLTTGNLAAGFFAIIQASSGNTLLAAYAIVVAAIFDILDGRAARMTGNVSKFGAEYDSIADTVSFGVAPAVIAFYAGHFADLGWAGWVLAFVYTACGSLRLARFNVQSGRYQGRFDGLPSPAAAAMVASSVWLKDLLVGPSATLGLPPILPALGVAALGLLMVSPIPYHSFKNVRFGRSYGANVAVVILTILALLEPRLNSFLVGLTYVLSGPVEYLWRAKTGRELLPAERDADQPSTNDDPNVTSLADHVQAGDARGNEKG